MSLPSIVFKASRWTIVFALWAMILGFASVAFSDNGDPELLCSNYEANPPFIASGVMPSTHIILDNSGSMHEFAYQEELAWFDYSSTTSFAARSGFNATQAYTGYFDPYEYYSYNSTEGYFSVDTQNGPWSGNFLNWVSMHRIDIARHVMTGGKYNSTTNTLEVQISDSSDRGRFKVFDDSETRLDLNGQNRHMTPHTEEIVFSLPVSGIHTDWYVYSATSSGDDWSNDGHIATYEHLQVHQAQAPKGVLDNINDRMRLSLFVFDRTGDTKDGAHMLEPIGANATAIKEAINGIYPSTWTPLAESLRTVVGYVQQSDTATASTGPYYEGDDSYSLSPEDDPFYFPSEAQDIYCSQQNVILISDGESTMDEQIAENLHDYDSDNNDPGDYLSSGTDYLDDVALWAHTTDLRSDLAGNQTVDLYTISIFGGGEDLLRDAAVNGGFVDLDGGGQPTASSNGTSEFDRDGDGEPDHFFRAETGEELEGALIQAFSSILNRLSSGSAASVISTSRKGGGAIFQAVFWPNLIDEEGNQVSWVGDVHSLLVDDYGNLYEDDGSVEFGLDDGDSSVILYYDPNAEKTRACSDGKVLNGICNGTAKDINEVEFLWSAMDWLNRGGTLFDAVNQRTEYTVDSTTDNERRYMMTWVDADTDGVVDDGEYQPFTTDLDVDYCSNATINWVRGLDQDGLKSREFWFDTNNDGVADDLGTWRLGDVVHSSPTVVGPPMENYDFYWGDRSYSEFYGKYRDRRYMVYFGGNDGMLHAVNSGFYSSNDKTFYKSHNPGTDSYSQSGAAADLGAEMWSYVPYNLLPHLECLTKDDSNHEYMVDLRPRVFDVKIFFDENGDPIDADHPGGWGTILVSGMRFGGAGTPTEFDQDRFFGSSYCIFDITNPEKAPTFLGEITYDGDDSLEMGYSITTPTVVPVKSGSGLQWYLILGTGPDSLEGTSEESARVVVIPLLEIVDNNGGPDSDFSWQLPGCSSCDPSPTEAGFIKVTSQGGAVGTDFVALDYDFDFFTDILYFGTVEEKKGDWSGGLWQLKIEDEPDPGKWEDKEKIHVDSPITGAPNIGFYGENVWVYFGTGKFWNVADKTDTDTNAFYGIIEPKQTTGPAYNFSTITDSGLVDVTDIRVENGSSDLLCVDGSTNCLPNNGATDTFYELVDHITNTSNVDGWKRTLTGDGERVIGQPTLLGGVVTYSSYLPNDDVCQAEGRSNLYALYYLTGTSWVENVFGDQDPNEPYIGFIKSLGKGMSITPNLHLGKEKGTKVFVQSSTGEILEINQPNLPIKDFRSGSGGWHTHDLE
ncbi:pilus assembly protein [Desulfohalobium retbaense]|uniref:Tfp pilus assembly protein tip-associated adhesin PilY1-like protein n=1 Tax=Desulfohalobium retbaense (strain ATCC 49708 / DSM 5692 / JCM 16813 / HR100) TaxID=485915 RepID=C8X3I1_DESRD|nr:PilC/PilY family type IV pilus protein [Desulfohalobium retbaense]ACV68978.1 Tfp pilus assembly protein tip-associated adhesin PilY1-like protein [Desulfohalobium retbaense DSM 5692]